MRAVIEGKEYRLLLDTGHTGTLALYASEQPPGELIEVESSNAVGTVRTYKCAERVVPVQIGQPPQTIVQEVFYIAPDERAHAQVQDRVHSKVGWGWLSKFECVTLDLSSDELVVVPSATPADDDETDGVELPLLATGDEEDPKWPVVTVSVGNWQGPAVLDTGLNGVGIGVAASLAQRQGWAGDQSIAAEGEAAGGERIEVQATRCPNDLILAGVVFRGPVIGMLDQWALGDMVFGKGAEKDEVIVIGAEILRHFKIRFFPKQKRAIFYRPPDAPPVVEQRPMRTLGFEMPRDGRVTRILSGSNAERAGLRVGDQVVTINGRCEDLTPEEIHRWIQSDDELEFVVQRDGQELTLRFRPTAILSD